MPRPRSLTTTGIATAALVVVDRDGLDALSMRTVAAELGMGTMSLYRYVADRSQLEELVVDQVLDGVDLTSPARASWRTQVAQLVQRLRTAVREHPATIPLLLARRHASVASLRWIEATLRALTSGGFTSKQRVVAQRTLLSYVLGALQNEYYSPLGGAGTAAMAALSVEEYPHLAATAAQARQLDPDEEFRRGLDVVLRGLGPGS